MEEVAKYEGAAIDLVKDPERVLTEAKKAADALVRVVDAKPDKVIINGKKYLEFEDWQTLGRFYGLTAKVESTKPVNFEGVRGWEAHAIIRNREGEIISAADAMCLNDEEKWSARSSYEYQYVLKDGSKTAEEPATKDMVWIPNPNKPGKTMPKREKVKGPDVPVPFFQLRSMAQTRAAAKAFRNVLAWVVVLAGYRPTPAEEMSGVGEDIHDAEIIPPTGSNPEGKKDPIPPPPPTTEPEKTYRIKTIGPKKESEKNPGQFYTEVLTTNNEKLWIGGKDDQLLATAKYVAKENIEVIMLIAKNKRIEKIEPKMGIGDEEPGSKG